MIYTYGNRRIILGAPGMHIVWVVLPMAIPVLSEVLGDHISKSRQMGGTLAHLLLISLALVVACIMWRRASGAPHRQDVPTGLEISKEGMLRLYHDEIPYAEIPVANVSFVGPEKVTVLPWDELPASRLLIEPAMGGIDHVYVLPYLQGYSDFVSRLRARSPRLQPFKNHDEWGTSETGSGDISLFGMGIAVFALVLTVILGVVSLTQGRFYGRHGASKLTWHLIALGLFAAILILSVARARKLVTRISFFPRKLVVDRGVLWHTEVTPEDIVGFDVIPPGRKPERCIVRLRNDSFEISSSRHADYPDLVYNLRAFAERGK